MILLRTLDRALLFVIVLRTLCSYPVFIKAKWQNIYIYIWMKICTPLLVEIFSLLLLQGIMLRFIGCPVLAEIYPISGISAC